MWKILLYVLCGLSLIGTFAPKVDSKYWLIAGQEYFKGIYLLVNVVLLIGVLSFGPSSAIDIVVLAGLLIAIVHCAKRVYPFTYLGQVKIAKTRKVKPESQLKFFVFNVLQENDQYEKLLAEVEKESPDIVFLLETNTEWDRATSKLQREFPFVIKEIREDTYGLIFMSKKEIIEGGINHFVSTEVPSVEALLKIGEQSVRILGIHPKPPIPGEKLTSRTKDLEIKKSAEYLKAQFNEQHILIGDLNDVAWSDSATNFKKTTGMKDPREGRGFYATFPTYSFLKIPLDHVYASASFSLSDFRILENIGSDHFPVSVTFQLED